jgi:hypothetical protein
MDPADKFQLAFILAIDHPICFYMHWFFLAQLWCLRSDLLAKPQAHKAQKEEKKYWP